MRRPPEIYIRLGLIAAIIAPSYLLLPSAAFGVSPPKRISVAPVDYIRDIRPILAANCFTCHGMDEKKRQANLRLDNAEAAYSRTVSGDRPIVPGKPDQSSMLKRIADHGALRMPPITSGKSLQPAEVALLQRWVREGGKYAAHWAFSRPIRPVVPTVAPGSLALNPVDNFVQSKLHTSGLTLLPSADRYTLIRRLSLDLIGLPPTTAETDSFVSDRRVDAYGQLVDRLLSSPHFGEKWARGWLDLARFADSAGYGSDPLRPNLWPYRDWVINALNKNLPYNLFIRDQIAGDLLPNPTTEQLIATAYSRNTMTNTEGGTDREEFRTAAIKDRSTTTMQSIMGLTLGCAQCHSHKFDPISNREYYRMVAVYNQTADNDQPDEKPTAPVLSAIQLERKSKLEARVAELKSLPAPTAAQTAECQASEKQAAEIKPINLPVMQELPADKQRKSYMLTLGNFLLKGDQVEPGVPAAFAASTGKAVSNRLEFATWITAADNPLTARVAVNRIWAQLFGTGIVETEEDFGLQGALPSNQPLLDWLALEFMHPNAARAKLGAGDWDVKGIIRTIVTSAAYQQSSKISAAALEKDPRDRMLSRYPRRRLTAENIRDQALAMSGLLSEKIGGPSVFPPQPAGLWQAAFNGDRNYPTSTGEDRYRRGLYTFWRRTVPPPSMAAFDAPSREVCTIRRMPTNTPLQALVTLNDPVYVELAQAMARRIIGAQQGSPEKSAAYAIRIATSRPAAQAQIVAISQLYSTELARYTSDLDSAKKLAADPLGPLPSGCQPAEAAAWTVVCNVLMNMDAVLTVN